MKVLSKVLWAVDLNTDHNVSIEKIRNLVGHFGNELILLHVLPAHLKGKASETKIRKSMEFELRNKIVSQLELDNDNKVNIRIEVGDIATQINKVANEEDVNAIILNKGKTETLGINGFNTIRKLEKPVAVLPKRKLKAGQHIVCPVDNSEVSALALKSAILHAKKIGAKLSVISVFKSNTITSPRLVRAGVSAETENRLMRKRFRNELKSFLQNFDFSNIDAEALILEGNADEEIIKFSKDAQLLYVGGSGKRALQRAFLGSVSEKVIREVECAVVLVKNEDVFKLRIPSKLENEEKHFSRGKELRQLGFLKEAAGQFKAALTVNELHFSSIKALAEVYELKGKQQQSDYYSEMLNSITDKLNNRKIEHEIRSAYKTVG